GARADVLGVASYLLKMTPDELATQLRSGQSLADIAKSKSVDPQKVIEALVADATAKIDQAVKDGKVPADKAADIKSGLNQRITNLVNNAHPGGPHVGHRGFDGPPP